MIDDPLIPPVGLLVNGPRAVWRVWAPSAEGVDLILDGLPLPMHSESRGFFRLETPTPKVGDRYLYRLDGEGEYPDPASRWQPDGIGKPSAVWFPERYAWSDRAWKGIADRRDLVFYELHVGTFTAEGTFDAVLPRVPELLELGVTAIELMPVAQFPGRWSWGYDGVFPRAVQNSYGGPEGLQRLIDGCHKLGMAVFLDVVFNHFGPEGNVFPAFGPYFTEKYKTGWGHALNFDGPGSDPVRAYIIETARAWIRDFHFDGLRLDAADQIFDLGPSHILTDLNRAVHDEAERQGRHVHLFAETDLNDVKFVRPVERGGLGLDGHWNDDFHHAAHVVLTGQRDGYYADFGGPADLAKVYGRVFVNDGRYSPFRDRRHGTDATDVPGDRFVAFVQNHDQVGNRLESDRYAASLSPSATRLAAGILLLAPRLPLLFMGEEYGETNPFPFFCEFESPDLIEAVRAGRKAEFAHFGWQDEPPDPCSASTRDLAVLSWEWSDPVRAGLRRLYRDLLRLRREHPSFRDFGYGPVELLEGDVMVVRRGGVLDPSTPPAWIAFNLTGEPRPLPDGFSPAHLTFRSEVPDYGAAELPVADRLAPHEFVIELPGGTASSR